MKKSLREILDAVTWMVDPGHGWLQVPRQMALEMKLAATTYSYVDEKHIYLEEDCDAASFFNYLEKAFGREPVRSALIQKNVAEKYYDDCFIRELPRWCGSL